MFLAPHVVLTGIKSRTPPATGHHVSDSQEDLRADRSTERDRWKPSGPSCAPSGPALQISRAALDQEAPEAGLTARRFRVIISTW